VGFEGATVFEPDLGIHIDDIFVLDFASLYPSAMIQKNLSHECIVDDDTYDNLDGY
jgi:DNA polymerase elongation subunit (family B)